MATRSLTSRYESFRGQARYSSSNRVSSSSSLSNQPKSPSYSGHQGLLSETGLTDVSLNPTLPPEWVDIVDTVKKDMAKVKDALRSLQKLHGDRLKVSFGDDVIQEQERDIEILTQEITRLLRRSENNVKRIATAGTLPGVKLSDSDRVSRLNVMRGLAQDLQEQSRKFRQAQKAFLHNLREQESLGDNFGFRDEDDERKAISIEEAIDRGLTPEQMQQMQQLADQSDQRYQDIVKIAQSINDLASLFRELNVLVIEQGSLLDRIDYNVEQASMQVKQGVKELKEADEYSKKAYAIKCIIILIVVVIIQIGILIWKHSR